MAIDVQKKITNRRAKKVSSSKKQDDIQNDIQSHIAHHKKSNRFLESVDNVTNWMSSAVITMLAENLEDLNTSSYEFRTGIQRCIRRILTVTSQKVETVVFFHEALPGFTVLAIKKEGWGEIEVTDQKNIKQEKKSSKKTKTSVQENLLDDLDEERQEVVQSIVGAYVQRTGNRVLSIEGADIVLVMFPVSDLKKNLRDMGFWYD